MDEGLDPQVKLKLLEAERNVTPDYPNVKKGAGCGIVALVAVGVFSSFLVGFFRQLSTGEKISMVLGAALIAGLIAGGFAAFRPSAQ